MLILFPNVHVGEPLCYRSLTVFPLSSDAAGAGQYALSDEAIRAGTLEVREVSEEGSVPDLLVENKGKSRVLFIEGEELVGAKQNRVVNASILVAAESSLNVPVSCVEAGRWRYRTQNFHSGGTQSTSELRHALKRSVSQSLEAKRGYRSDQNEVWRKVACKQAALATESPTSALSDSFVASKEQIAEFREKIKYVEGARGMAVAVDGKIRCVDLFDKPETCHKVWDRFLTSWVLDALEAADSDRTVDAAEVEAAIRKLDDLSWNPCQTVGEGRELRTGGEDRMQGSVLLLEGEIVHAGITLLTA